MQTDMQEKEEQVKKPTDEKMTGLERFITIVAVILIIAIACVPAVIYCRMKANEAMEEKMKLQKAYYTEHNLTASEMTRLTNYFYIKTNPEWWLEQNEADWPDYSYYTLEPTEYTQLALDVLNYKLFVERADYLDTYRLIAERNGFSRENPITPEWVVENPAEALRLMNEYIELADFDAMMQMHDSMYQVTEEESISAKEFLESQFDKSESEE